MTDTLQIKVTGLSWLGIGTGDFSSTVAFFRDVMKLPLKVEDASGVAMFQIAERQVLEIFGPRTSGFTRTSPPVAAFEVEDVAAARAVLVEAGVELIGDIGSWNGFEWLYFTGPDGHTFAVKKTPPDGWEDKA